MTNDGAARPTAEPDIVETLRGLAVLRDRDVLTEQEFQQAKVKVVGASRPRDE